MASDRYGSARWAEAKDLKAEGIMAIPAARVARGDGDTEENRAFLLGCDADPAELTKDMRQGYSEMLGAISDGTANIIRKVNESSALTRFMWLRTRLQRPTA